MFPFLVLDRLSAASQSLHLVLLQERTILSVSWFHASGPLQARPALSEVFAADAHGGTGLA